MSMTWGELKKNILDLGFDTEYPDGMITASNRAIGLIYHTFLEGYENYFKKELSTNSYQWEKPTLTKITETTKDNFNIPIPDKLIELVPLLAAHYAWMDDDIQKATMYWNEYDSIRNTIETQIQRSQKCTFYPNFSLGW